MRTITLNKMHIANFKGIQDLEIAYNGQNTLIAGYNGTGKSTIADAFFWLTTGKNTALATKFEVRPRDKDNNEVHNVITTVEATFRVTNDNDEFGYLICLRRDELENLTDKERQALKPETIAKKKSFYFIDGAPYPENLFYGKVAEYMCDKNKLMLLSNPMAFFALDDKEQREILTATCGDVADSEIDGYDKVKEICGVNAPVTMRDGLAKTISVANKWLEETPARVDSLVGLCDEYADYDKQIAEFEKEQAEVKAQGEKLKGELMKLHDETAIGLVAPVDFSVTNAQCLVRRAEQNLEAAQGHLKDEQFYQSQSTCPNCGYVLQDHSDGIRKCEQEVKQYTQELEIAKATLEKVKAEYENAVTDYNSKLLAQKNEYQELEQECKTLETCLEKLRERHTELSVGISKLQQAKLIQAQIKALRDEQRTLDSGLAVDMTKFDIISAFLIRKAEAVVENINKRFERVKFKLFDMQTNGELKPCCKALIDGVSYANTNTASKVQVGIELIKLLSKLNDVTAPVWVDDKESVIDLPTIDAQTICLKVDERYKELHIEAV